MFTVSFEVSLKNNLIFLLFQTLFCLTLALYDDKERPYPCYSHLSQIVLAMVTEAPPTCW